MLSPLIAPPAHPTRIIPPGECWEAMSRRRSPRAGRRSRSGAPSAGSTFPAQPGSILAHFDASQAGTVTSASNKASSITNLTGAATSAVQATGATQPGYGLTTQNALNTLNCSANAFMVSTIPGTVLDFTIQLVIKTGASVAGAQGVCGTAGGGVVLQVNTGILRGVDYAPGSPIAVPFSDLAVSANTAYVATYRRSGLQLDAFLDGTKSVNGAAISSNFLITGWPFGNDDNGGIVDPFPGFFGEIYIYNVALSDADVLVNRAGLKAKWGTA
jgi:hypothetical protein